MVKVPFLISHLGDVHIQNSLPQINSVLSIAQTETYLESFQFHFDDFFNMATMTSSSCLTINFLELKNHKRMNN